MGKKKERKEGEKEGKETKEVNVLVLVGGPDPSDLHWWEAQLV